MSKKRDNLDDDGVFEWRRLVASLVAADDTISVAAADSAADGASALSSFSHLH